MDQPSFTKIYIDFPEVKKIRFKKTDIEGKNDRIIKRLIRNGIPRSFLFLGKVPEKRWDAQKLSIYTPQKVKIGRSCLITKKYNDKNSNTNFKSNRNNINNNLLYEYSKNDVNNQNLYIDSPNINLNSDSDINNNIISDNENVFNNKKGVRINKFYKLKNDTNNNEIKTHKKFTDLKHLLNINSKSSPRSNTPIFKKKVKLMANSKFKITNLGLRNKNENQ